MNQIDLELNKQEFSGGDTIAGTVVVRLDQDTRARGVRVRLKGYEKSIWSQGSGKSRRTYSEQRDFFDQEFTFEGRGRLSFGELIADSLVGVFSEDRYVLVRAGTYRYPFSFELPPNLPGGYKSSISASEIHYSVKAQVDLPLKADLRFEQPLQIRGPGALGTPHALTEQKTKRFLFDSDSSIEAAVHLDKNIFGAGETIDCYVEVMNRAVRKEIDGVTLALRQLEILSAKGRTHEQAIDVEKTRFDECRFPIKERSRRHLWLEIPPDVSPTVTGSLVKLRYELQVTLHIPWAVDTKLSVPVVLARHPDRSSVTACDAAQAESG